MSDTFERACAAADVPDEGVVPVEVGGVEVAVVKSEGQYFAVRDECSHAQIQLSEGDVGECEIECWLHGSRFDLRTGKPTGLPATEPVAVFPIEVRDGEIYVDTAVTLNGVHPS